MENLPFASDISCRKPALNWKLRCARTGTRKTACSNFPCLQPSLKHDYIGQVAYGAGELPANGDEAVAQKWVAVVSDAKGGALTCINDGVYGSDFVGGKLRLTLLRSPAYSGHPIHDRPIVPQDRYTPRIDQGERVFRFWFNGGQMTERLTAVDREALVHNERPYALSFFPHGGGESPPAGLILSDNVVQITAFKQSEDGKGFIVRMFEPTGRPRTTTLTIPGLDMTSNWILMLLRLKPCILIRKPACFLKLI